MSNKLQQLVNVVYRYPKARFKKYNRFGGYFNYHQMIIENKRMENASHALPPVTSHQDGLTIYFLTGEKFLYQTLFCIQSLVKVSNTKFRFVLIDDGTFNKDIRTRIQKQLPNAEIINTKLVENNLQAKLPYEKFTVLHEKRKIYPHLKKLTDVHTLPGDWKLVLDSDMLFWKKPIALLDWLQKPELPFYMLDCINSYGYTKQLMQKLSNSSVPDLLNVGIIGLNSDTINWHQLNNWIKVLEEREGASYYLEQALTAMLIGEYPAKVLDANEYIVNPNKNDVLNSHGTLHHYVDLSKEYYFKTAWKKIISPNYL